ncbi:hypothetical protein BHM03_00061820 [Ensete ventricosum]|nr:hypothetical protein BHM03_00061820 [Ensete ventricosum]
MSHERSSGNSGAEHHPEPNHPHPTNEATVVVPTPNHFWRMMTDSGFPSPASNPAPFVITAEAFLGLNSQVQALAGMVAEARAASPTPTPARSQSRSYNPIRTEPDFDTLSTDTADSLREQVRRVHQRLDEVQKEVLKSRGEVGESSKGGSPFTPKIQAKSVSTTFRLPTLEPYDGSGDPTEHIAAFRAQMAFYDTSDALMDGPRERRTPLPVRGAVHIVDEAPPRGAVPWTSRATTKEEGRQVGHVASQTTPPIPLNSTRTEIFFQIRERGLLKAPSPMKSHPERCDKRRYYRFHREYIHDTKECRDLQYQIKDLIRQGHLRRYVREQSSVPDDRPPQDSSPWPKGPVEKQIDVIFSGPASGGNSSSAQKAYARSEVGKKPLHDERRWRYIQVGRRGASMP